MFIDEQRGRFGVEPICRTLGVSASAYYQRATGERSARTVEDERLLERIRELHRRNYFAYGSWRMWKALLRSQLWLPVGVGSAAVSWCDESGFVAEGGELGTVAAVEFAEDVAEPHGVHFWQRTLANPSVPEVAD